MRRFGLRLGSALLAATLPGSAAVAQPAGRSENPPAEARIIPYSGVLPACDDPAVLADIAFGFADRERQFWNSGLEIARFLEVGEIGLRSNGPSYIPRRYCRGKADFNDGRSRGLGYEIGERGGFIGWGYGVTWCVVGLDRNHAFSPNCRATGP